MALGYSSALLLNCIGLAVSERLQSCELSRGRIESLRLSFRLLKWGEEGASAADTLTMKMKSAKALTARGAMLRTTLNHIVRIVGVQRTLIIGPNVSCAKKPSVTIVPTDGRSVLSARREAAASNSSSLR